MNFLGKPTPWYERSMFEPRWNQPKREEFFSPWSWQPRRQVFINPEDYYDPLFGGKQQQQQCYCRKCAEIMATYKEQQSLADERKQRRLNQIKKKHSDHQINQKQNNGSIDNKLLAGKGGIEPKEDPNLKKNVEGVKPIADSLQPITITEDNSNEKEVKKGDPITLQKINTINKIKSEVKLLCEKVNSISFQSKEYEYLYCEEMLTKCLLELDDILTEGEESIKKARKELVLEINRALLELENNRSSNSENDELSEEEIQNEFELKQIKNSNEENGKLSKE